MGYYPQKAFVSRLNPTATNNDIENYVTFSGFGVVGARTAAIPINVQPATAEFTALHEGQQGKMFNGFTTASDVVEGHRLTVSGTGEIYTVRGRQAFNYGMGQHYELVLVRGHR